MLVDFIWTVTILASLGMMAFGADLFTENVARASVQLGISTFGLAVLLAGAEPEELIASVFSSFQRAPAIALGDVIGTNITICLVALGLGAVLFPIRLSRKTLLYGVLALIVSIPGFLFSWTGHISRVQGFVLVGVYVLYVAVMWIGERKPPDIGEVDEIEEAREKLKRRTMTRSGEVWKLFAGLAAMTVGGAALVYAVERLSLREVVQAKLGMTLIGFATGFEVILLAWAGARRGEMSALSGAVFGSCAYNLTMTIGAAAIVRPITLVYPDAVRSGLIAAPCALALPLFLGVGQKGLNRASGAVLLLSYAVFTILIAR